jgi:hypothetical protein
MRSPGAVSPSDKSVWAGWGGKLLEPVVKGAGPDIYSGVKKKATDWWNAKPSDLSNEYNNLSSPDSMYSGMSPSTFTDISGGNDAYSSLGGDYPDWGTYAQDIPWGDIGADVPWADVTPDFSDVYSVASW